MLSRTIKAMRRRVGPVGLSVAAAALTAVAFAAVSVAQDDSKGEQDEGERGAFFEHHVGPPGPPDISDEDRQAMEEFHACMKENGADLPEPPDPSEFEDGERPAPPEPPSETDREAIEKALEACKDKLPEGAAFGIGPGAPCGPPRDGKKGDVMAIPGPPPPGADSQQSPSS